MELISRVSKGSRMDQIYIPKNRVGFNTGSYVLIKPLEVEEITEKPLFYNVKGLEPIKTEIINKIFRQIEKGVNKYENIIITGSFLDKGFKFNDIDVILISEDKINATYVENTLKAKIGMPFHIIVLNHKTLLKGLSTDPLFSVMLSKCVSKKRFVYRVEREMNHKLMDLHLLKSQLLIENFDFLIGTEKYSMTRNLVAISLFIDNKTVTREIVDQNIDKLFGKETVKNLKENMLEKKEFLDKYKKFYNKTFSKIMKNVSK